MSHFSKNICLVLRGSSLGSWWHQSSEYESVLTVNIMRLSERLEACLLSGLLFRWQSPVDWWILMWSHLVLYTEMFLGLISGDFKNERRDSKLDSLSHQGSVHDLEFSRFKMPFLVWYAQRVSKLVMLAVEAFILCTNFYAGKPNMFGDEEPSVRRKSSHLVYFFFTLIGWWTWQQANLI